MSIVVITEKPGGRTTGPSQTVSSPSRTTTVDVGKTPVFVQGLKGDKGDTGLQGLRGIQGLPGETAVGTGDLHYDHDQMSASDTWIINHGLNKFPSVTVIDSSGAGCEGHVTYVSTAQIIVTFSSAFAGHAYLN